MKSLIVLSLVFGFSMSVHAGQNKPICQPVYPGFSEKPISSTLGEKPAKKTKAIRANERKPNSNE